MEMKCSVGGETLKPGEPHCSQCHATMTCDADKCICPNDGNTVMMSEIKCDVCLGMEKSM